ncbi:MAG: hypothetical protein AB7U95_30515, partial [Reyranella sp.]
MINDDRATGVARPQRIFLALFASVASLGIVAAQAQQPPQTPQTAPRAASVNLRPIPDGPGRRVAELQGLDKVTARTQRFVAPVGEATRFGTL